MRIFQRTHQCTHRVAAIRRVAVRQPFSEEKLRHRRVVGLSGGGFELHRQTIADDPDVQLGRKSFTTSTDTSVSGLFFWVAAC